MQRTIQLGEHLAATWGVTTANDLQQHIWLYAVYATAVGGNAEGIIATLQGLMNAQAKHFDAKGDQGRADIYRSRLRTMNRTGWNMVYTAQEKHIEWFVKSELDDYPLTE